jgi:DNA polymerase
MKRLWLDFETRSYINLKDTGLDRYAKDASTEVLMLGWAYDNDPVKLWVPIRGQMMPPELHAGLIDPTVTKMAWNYNFEKDIFHYKLGYVIPQTEWFDPNVLCANMSLPIGLDRAAKALNIDIELKKTVITGKSKPTKVFSEPSKYSKTFLKKNPQVTSSFYFKNWESHPEKWQEFCDYCCQDVIAERAVYYAAVAMNCELTDGEVLAWLLDQRMNETGVYIDRTFVENAKGIAEAEVGSIITALKNITGCNNPNSGKQLGDWLRDRGYKFDSLDKEHIAEAILYCKKWGMTPEAIQVLDLKKKLGGSAYTKLETILDRVGADGRLRDQFVYHGAHTGRWSGRGVQLQNLFKPTKDVSTLREWIVAGIRDNNMKIQTIFTEYNDGVTAWNAANPDKKQKDPVKKCPTMMDAVAGTIRASFVPTPGNKFSVADLAQIESRVLAALAGCQTMIDAYKSGLDLYKDIMVFLLNDEIAEWNQHNPDLPKKLRTHADITSAERANGKVIILGCGFGMGWEKFIEYAATFGVTLDEKMAKKYVTAFRDKYPEIPSFWKELNAAVVTAVKANICIYVRGLVVDGRNPQMLKIKLPCGRCLHYLEPIVTQETTDWGKTYEGISYHAWDAKGMQLKRLYGGLLCENVVQAVARDVLVNGGLEAEKMGFLAVMTIHDEWVMESPIASPLTYKDLENAMTRTPSWAEGMGFILAAEGYDAKYYRK